MKPKLKIALSLFIAGGMLFPLAARADNRVPWTPLTDNEAGRAVVGRGFDQGKTCSIVTNGSGGSNYGCLSYPYTGRDTYFGDWVGSQFDATPLNNTPIESGARSFARNFNGGQNYIAGFARGGLLAIGGWEYFYGSGLGGPFSNGPNTHLANVRRNSTSVYKTVGAADAIANTTATVVGDFVSRYGPNTRLCLEVYDYGIKDANNRFPSYDLLGTQCQTPSLGAAGSQLHSFALSLPVLAGHMIEIEVVAHHEGGTGAAQFQVTSITHDLP